MYHNFMPTFPALTHFAVTVSDLDRSIAWYEALFETPAFFVGDEATYRFAVWLEPSFALHEHATGSDGSPFDEHRIGLDHIAFGCATREELEAWPARLDTLGIEHGEIWTLFTDRAWPFGTPTTSSGSSSSR